IVRFIRSFLQDRTIRLTIGNFIAEPITVTTGILQGFFLLLILFLFFASTLLLILQRGNITAYRFINNINILIYSKSIEENYRAIK
ncbi:uncharacterized protein BDZ99DRAFT_392495, partial [Mytilinidion resinicola]